MKDYQKMWENLKLKIEADLRYHESGIMQSMAESFEGENKCREVLRYMKSLEEMIPEVAHEDVNSEKFALVPASTLSLTDKFMFHTPKNKREQIFKDMLTNVIKSGVSDFYRPRLDPSFDKYGKICYQAGLKPAVCKSYNWWEENAKEFCPERKSRLGTKSEYVAFLGVLLKNLVASGWKVDTAWSAVCNGSEIFGHYWNSYGSAFYLIETTGSRCVCGYCDLANTYKILAEDKEAGGYWLAGGRYRYISLDESLSGFEIYDNRFNDLNHCVGWLVLEK